MASRRAVISPLRRPRALRCDKAATNRDLTRVDNCRRGAGRIGCFLATRSASDLFVFGSLEAMIGQLVAARLGTLAGGNRGAFALAPQSCFDAALPDASNLTATECAPLCNPIAACDELSSRGAPASLVTALRVVREGEPAVTIAGQTTDRRVAQKGHELRGHARGFRAARTIASMFAAAGPDFGGGLERVLSSANRPRFTASSVRSTSASSARGFPPFDVDDPLPADADAFRQFELAEVELMTALTDESTDVLRGSQAHVVVRRHSEMSPLIDIVACQRLLTSGRALARRRRWRPGNAARGSFFVRRRWFDSKRPATMRSRSW